MCKISSEDILFFKISRLVIVVNVLHVRRGPRAVSDPKRGKTGAYGKITTQNTPSGNSDLRRK